MEIRSIENDAADGERNALECYYELREIEEAAALSKSKIMESALNEFRNYGEKSISLYGYEISESASGRYDYKDIPEWSKAKDRLIKIEEKAKLAYKAGDSIDGIQPAIYSNNKPGLTFKKIR